MSGYFEEKATTAVPQPTEPKVSWEKVAEYTYRLVVPGGWLYRYRGGGDRNTMCFVQAPIFPNFQTSPPYVQNPLPAYPSYPAPTWPATPNWGGCGAGVVAGSMTGTVVMVDGQNGQQK